MSGQILVFSDLENYPGAYPSVDGYDFAEKMKKQAESFGASFSAEKVTALDKIDKKFTIQTEKNTYTSHAVIIATGAKHRTLDIPGETEFAGKGVSYCATCDGPFFRGKKIIVVGGGDAACDEASYLANLSPHVTIIHRKDRFRAQKAVARRVLHNPHIKVLFNTVVLEINGDSKVTSVTTQNVLTKKAEALEADAVFIFVGLLPHTDLVQTVKKDETGYIVTNEQMETSVKGLFCAGDVRAKPFRQVITAVSDGAVAARCAATYIEELNDEAYE